MQSRLLFVFACLFGFAGRPLFADTPYPNIAPTEPKTPEEERKTFKLPPGFEAQLVASEPDIRKPIQMAFDARGRLWVTTSEEYPFAAVGRPGKDRLYVLEDFGADGKARKVSIFADDLNIPIGVLPLPDCKSVIVSSIEPAPNKETPATCWIWKLTDTDGDGKCDKKEKLYGPFGCRDTHGMNNSYTLMPDGWVYACHGYLNDSKPRGKDGHEIFMNSGNTFRFRPDGSRIENWTYGQVNPFGIAVDPSFNLYTADCHSRPITQLIRGATYQSFSKPHDGLGFAPHVAIHGHDSTALCGLVYYAADHFPKEFLDHMFLGNVTSNCINWDRIEFKGSTPVAIDKGMFLSSNDYWFRPTDIKLGPDGALYFADFYNKIIGHYEVDLKHPDRDKLRGRVWRIVWKGKDGKGDVPAKMTDWTKADARELIDALDNPNLAVRLTALHQVRERNVAIENEWPKRPSEVQKAMGLWAFEIRRALKDEPGQELAMLESPLEAVHKARIVAARSSCLEKTFAPIFDDASASPRTVRAAVEAAISHPSPNHLRALLAILDRAPAEDNHLRHAARVALRAAALPLINWNKASGNVDWTEAQIKVLAEIALAVPTVGAAEFLEEHLGELSGDEGRLLAYIEHAVHQAPDEALRTSVLKFVSRHGQQNVRLSVQMLKAYVRGTQKRGSARPIEAARFATRPTLAAIETADPATIQAGIELAVIFRDATAFDPLARLVNRTDRGEAERSAALAALATIDAKQAEPILVKMLNSSAEPIALREKAAQVLGGLNRAGADNELVKALQAAPARLQTVIALAMAGNGTAAERFLKAVEEGKASARLLQDKTVQTKLNDSKVARANERIAALTKGLPSADQKMLDLMKRRSVSFAKAKPDAFLGKLVFTKHCAICHQIGNAGVKIGPQLDGIGGRGVDRLLEDILDPSRNVDAAFRQTTLVLKDGKSVPGLVLREEGEIVVMADDKGKEIRIPKDDIDSRRASLLSPMPANVVDIIPEKDFYDLIAYLLTQRASEEKKRE
jgi:putative heme-binding domain-containing protein